MEPEEEHVGLTGLLQIALDLSCYQHRNHHNPRQYSIRTINRICWNIWIQKPRLQGVRLERSLDFPEVPADLESFTFDTSSFPDFPEYLNSGPPTSPATAATFIDDYLNAPTTPQGLLGFEGGPVVPEPTMLLAPAAVVPLTAPEVVPQVVPAPAEVAAATGMTTGTPKPRSPRRSRSPPSNPNRLIALNTPAVAPMGDSATARSQTPDARAASPEEEDVNAIPTKGPLRVRKDTIAAKKRANRIREAAKTLAAQDAAKTLSARLPTGETVQRARRSARPNIPQPGAMTISPENFNTITTAIAYR
jgi:hypothetical protein